MLRSASIQSYDSPDDWHSLAIDVAMLAHSLHYKPVVQASHAELHWITLDMLHRLGLCRDRFVLVFDLSDKVSGTLHIARGSNLYISYYASKHMFLSQGESCRFRIFLSSFTVLFLFMSCKKKEVLSVTVILVQ